MRHLKVCVAVLIALSLCGFAEAKPPITGRVVSSSGQGCDDGAILIDINAGTAPYTVQWKDANGIVIYSDFNIDGQDGQEDLHDIGVGTYSVSITDAWCGSEVAVFIVTNNPLSVTIDKITHIQGCTESSISQGQLPGAYGGIAISCVLSDAGGDISYKWTGPNGYTRFTEDISDIRQPGVYKISIVYNDVCRLSESVQICCCSLDAEAEDELALYSPGCSSFDLDPDPIQIVDLQINYVSAQGLSDGGIVFDVEGGGGEYFYKWTGPSGYASVEKNLFDIIPGEYYVTISDGCDQITDEFNVLVFDCQNPPFESQLREIFIISEHSPCPGVNDGFIVLGIPNALGAPIKIKLDNVEIYNFVGNEAYEQVTINSILGNTSYNLKIAFGSCNVMFNFSIGLASSQSVYDRLEGFNCIYDDFCGAISLGEHTESAKYSFLHGSGGDFFESCKLPIFCHEQEVGEKSFDRINVSFKEYFIILTTIGKQVLHEADYSYLLYKFNSKVSEGYLPCQRVKYCPADFSFRVAIGAHFLAPFGNYDCDLRCCESHCWLHPNDDFCTSDLNIPEEFSEYLSDAGPLLDWTLDCNPKAYNLRSLILQWKDGCFALVDGFENSDLFLNYIDRYDQGEYNEILSACATVYFCTSNLVVQYCNFDEVACVEDGCPYEDVDLSYNGVEVWYCSWETSGYFLPREYGHSFVNTTCDPDALEYRSSVEVINKFIVDSISNETFSHFTTILHETYIVPKGIFTDAEGSMYFYDYNHRVGVDEKIELDGQMLLYENWDNGNSFNCMQLAPNYYEINRAENDSLVLKFRLFATTELEVLEIQEVGTSIVLIGTSDGQLYKDNYKIGFSETPLLFYISISEEGDIEQKWFFENVSMEDPIIVTTDSATVYTAFTTQGGLDELSIGRVIESDTSSWIILSFGDHSFEIEYFKDMANTNVDITSMDVVMNDKCVLALQGSGIVNADNNNYELESGDLGLLILDFSTEVETYFQIYGNIFEHDIALKSENELVIGVTFEGDLVFEEYTSISTGGKDIAIIKSDLAGKQESRKIWGDEHNQVLRKLLISGDVIYFGGELEGAPPEEAIEVGEYWFRRSKDLGSEIYLSYTIDEELEESIVEETTGAESVHNFEQITQPLIYPNPTNKEFTITGLPQECKTVFLSNLDGIKMQEWNLLNVEDNSKATLVMDNGWNGLFMLVYLDSYGAVIAVSKIVLVE